MPLHPRSLRARSALGLAVLAVVFAPWFGPAGATAGEQPARKAASINVSPSAYVPGQAVRFTGNIGRSGKRSVHLQSHMQRPGDTWLDVPGSTFSTDAQGNFDYTFTAPSMFQISYRVVGKGLATPAYAFKTRPQEITLTLEGEDADSPFYDVLPLSQFTVVADATPAVRSKLGTPPPIPGRTVRLQERAGNGWRTIASKLLDADGHATFDLTAPATGQWVLRARQERWTPGKNEIGWFPSFPAYFVVGTPTPRPTAARLMAMPTASRSEARPTASERYGWGNSTYDFAWERGQDLSSPPSKGTKPRGSWVETSDGTGRVVPFNGALVLQSKLKHGGDGDLGTTTATLTGNSQKRGRWEFRIQGHVWEPSGKPYRFLLELVPDGAGVQTCSPETVVVADFTMGAAGMDVGVRSRAEGSVWSRTIPGVRLAETPINVAVEIGKKHISWFRDGSPVATVKSGKAPLGLRLVPRLSLVGQQAEMAGAQVDSDWQRSWNIRKGKQVKSGAKLTRSAYSASC